MNHIDASKICFDQCVTMGVPEFRYECINKNNPRFDRRGKIPHSGVATYSSGICEQA